MKNISLNIDKVAGFVSKETIAAYEPQVKACMETLENGTGKGNDFLGWLHLPSSITAEHLADLKATAQVLRDNCEVVVVAGIGGSYLGARAVIDGAVITKFQACKCKTGFVFGRTLRFSTVAFEFIFPLTETSQLIVDLGFTFEAKTGISSITIICIIRGEVVLGINFPV